MSNNIRITQISQNGTNTISGNIHVQKPLKQNSISLHNPLSDKPKAFIIHGHDEVSRLELKTILLELNVKPIVLVDDGLNGKSIIENIEFYAKECVMAFAVFTYDDIIQNGDNEYLQVRPNVIFELGYFYAKLGRENVMILEQENPKGSIFSDIDGIYRYQFIKKISEQRDKIAELVCKFTSP